MVISNERNGVIDRLLRDIPLPRMLTVSQRFDRPRIEDPERAFLDSLRDSKLFDSVKPGMSIAIGAGSRGISNYPLFLRALVEELKRREAAPYVVPAMGSHGGATAEGQRRMLEGMGVTETSVGAPIRATMDVVTIGTTPGGLPVSIDAFAHEADGVVVMNRIKPHVGFRGPFESGLMKMMAIGFGKQRGAEICHDLGFGQMAENIRQIGSVFLENVPVIAAIGLMENAYHETCRIETLAPDEIAREEPALQEEAKRLSPRIHLQKLDVLIIDEIGKDISGTGFDTNVVGRFHTPYASGGPDITRIAVLDLTDASHGNANGIGIVDFTTKRVFDKMIPEETYPNSLTSTVPISVKMPMVLTRDRHAIQAAIRTSNVADKQSVRVVRIKNTISLESIRVSENMRQHIESHPQLEISGAAEEWRFDGDGNVI